MSRDGEGIRRYRGVSPAERTVQRRERLIEAAVEVFGTEGYRTATVRSLCTAAQLNQRYFYESFETKEDVLWCVFEEVVDAALADVTAAVLRAEGTEERIRAGLRAWWYAVTGDARVMRILALEIAGVSERIERARRERRHQVARLIEAQLLESAGPAQLRPGVDLSLVAHSLIAAVIDPVIDWMRGESGRTLDELIEYGTRVFMDTRATLLSGAAPGSAA